MLVISFFINKKGVKLTAETILNNYGTFGLCVIMAFQLAKIQSSLGLLDWRIGQLELKTKRKKGD